jgi:hypothetical protein
MLISWVRTKLDELFRRVEWKVTLVFVGPRRSHIMPLCRLLFLSSFKISRKDDCQLRFSASTCQINVIDGAVYSC